MDAFFLPRSVPPLIGLGSFETADDLFTFLRETQPPQRPGTLSDPDYGALTLRAFVPWGFTERLSRFHLPATLQVYRICAGKQALDRIVPGG